MGHTITKTEAERIEYGIALIKQVLTALRDKQYNDISLLVDKHSMSADDYVECVQKSVEAHGFSMVDDYNEFNLIEKEFDYDVLPSVLLYMEYDITADGEFTDMSLILELEFCADSTVISSLDIKIARS